ncbi:perforin-1.2 [Pimephales promelas]|nr:perforin-1.2 [Pimephales promelas]
MAVFNGVRLVSLAVLVLVSQLDSASAAVRVFGLSARGLGGDDFEDYLDPYLKVRCGSSFGQTESFDDNNNPTWSVEFNFPTCNQYDELEVELWDSDLFFDEHFATYMAVFNGVRLVSLAVLVLVSQLDSASAAVRVFGLSARGLTGDGFENFLDPYLKVRCGSSFGQTESFDDNNNPTWSVEFNFPNCNRYDKLEVELWDSDLFFDEYFGTCSENVMFKGVYSITCRGSEDTLFYSYELLE